MNYLILGIISLIASLIFAAFVIIKIKNREEEDMIAELNVKPTNLDNFAEKPWEKRLCLPSE